MVNQKQDNTMMAKGGKKTNNDLQNTTHKHSRFYYFSHILLKKNVSSGISANHE